LTILDATHANVSGRLWVDINHDGIQNDPPHNTAVVPVKLYDENGALVAETTTDTNGNYVFSGIETSAASGKEYYVKFALPVSGFEFTIKDAGGDDSKDSDVDDTTGETDNFALTGNNAKMDAGIIFAALGDYVWNDTNENGIQDADEDGLGGVRVNLYKNGDSAPIMTTQTDPSGKYAFEPLSDGTYQIEVIPPTDFTFSPMYQGIDPEKDSDFNQSTGRTSDIPLVFPGDANHYTKYDAGLHIDWPNVAEVTITKLTNGVNTDNQAEPIVNIVNGNTPTVTWTYIIANGGKDANLSDIKVTDDQGVTVHCPKDALLPGETMTCTASGDAIVGHYTNEGTVEAIATVQGQTHPVGPTSDTSSYTGNALTASLSIEKSTNGKDADTEETQDHIDVGTPITWEYVVENTGDTNISAGQVTDSIEGLICEFDVLTPGQTKTCTKTGTAQEGQYENTATVTGLAYGFAIEASDKSHYLGRPLPVPHPSIVIDKATNGNSGNSIDNQAHVAVGDPIRWTYYVVNNGDTDFTDIKVTDDQEGDVPCPKTMLAPQEEMVCTLSGTAEAGQYINTATVVAWYGENNVTATDTSYYFGVIPQQPNPSMQFDKSTNGGDGVEVEVGDKIIWSYYIINNGNELLYDIQVTDDKEGEITCPSTTLAVGKSMRCTKEGTAQAIPGGYKNTGTVTAKYGNFETYGPVSDDSNYIIAATESGGGENCPCNDVHSDGSDAMGTTGMMSMILMTLFSALFFMRKEEEFNATEK